MPAEWEAHEATWLTWPTNKITWPGKMLKEVESIYLQMMQALLTGEKVHLLVPDKATAKMIVGSCGSSEGSMPKYQHVAAQTSAVKAITTGASKTADAPAVTGASAPATAPMAAAESKALWRACWATRRTDRAGALWIS